MDGLGAGYAPASDTWSSWWGDIVGTAQEAVGEWFEGEVYEELGLSPNPQTDANLANSAGLGLPSAHGNEISHIDNQVPRPGWAGSVNWAMVGAMAGLAGLLWTVTRK